MTEVKPIILTDEEKKDCSEVEIQIIDITNKLIIDNLCGYELTLDNGWKISFKNKKFSKQIGVPM